MTVHGSGGVFLPQMGSLVSLCSLILPCCKLLSCSVLSLLAPHPGSFCSFSFPYGIRRWMHPASAWHLSSLVLINPLEDGCRCFS